MGRFTVEHHGVKGMHWGVRREDAAAAGKLATTALKAKGDKTKKVYAQHVKEVGGLHKIDDKKLQAMLNRMNMEQQFSKMMSAEADKRAEGRKAAVKLIVKIGEIAIPLIAGAFAAKAAAPAVFKTVSLAQKALGR